jgi:periplasmic protein TonB
MVVSLLVHAGWVLVMMYVVHEDAMRSTELQFVATATRTELWQQPADEPEPLIRQPDFPAARPDFELPPDAPPQEYEFPQESETPRAEPTPPREIHVVRDPVVPAPRRPDTRAFPRRAEAAKAAETPPPALPTVKPPVVVAPAPKTDNAPPKYPRQARARGYEGKVVVRVLVASDGTAKSATIAESSSFASLDTAARDAVLAWHFFPGTKDGTPQEAYINITVRFKLEDE